jgi:hypothetical protein
MSLSAMSTRWSCTSDVVVHEMAHLLEPTHNARFIATMDRSMRRGEEGRARTRVPDQQGDPVLLSAHLDRPRFRYVHTSDEPASGTDRLLFSRHFRRTR